MSASCTSSRALSLAVFSLLCLGCSVVLGNYHQTAAVYPQAQQQQQYYAVPAAQYQQQYHQQQAGSDDHRVVDEKDYDVGGFSYWYLCMPIILIPLLLLLCTPLMYKPLDPHHGWGGGLEHGGGGYGGFGGFGGGGGGHHRIGETSQEEEVQERVLKSISSSPAKKSKKPTNSTARG